MHTVTKISIIDPSNQRRAAITHALHNEGLHAIPYDCVDDLPALSKCGGLYMVTDEGRAVEALLEYIALCSQPYAVIAVAEKPEPHEVVRAMRLGVDDYLAWPLPQPSLASTVISACSFVEKRSALDDAAARAKVAVSRLSERERQVLNGIARGHKNKEIAGVLGISPRTVEIHRSNMFNKLQARNAMDAVRIATGSGLIAVL